MKKLLIYSHDTFGLGNMRRMMAIAEHLTQQNPELNVLMLSGSNAIQAFQLPCRVDYVKLPCLHRDVNGRYDAKSLNMSLKSIIRLRSNLILSAALDFKPDLIIVDKKPFGVSNELEPVLSILRRRTNPPRMVLLLRDILDDARATQDIWSRNGYHEAIDRYYEAVLVVGDQNVYDLGKEYNFPVSTRARTRYCGCIQKPNDPPLAPETESHPSVLVTSGGGEDGEQLIQTFIDCMSSKTPDFKSLIYLGPELSEKKAAKYTTQVQSNPTITCHRFTNQMSQHMSQAKVLVTMGGYNTIYEGLSLQKSMVVVPRTKPSREQEIRAQRLSEMGFLECLMPKELTTDRLRSSIDNTLHLPLRSLPKINFGGLNSVNQEIRALCGVA